jgi:hypothetical protein
MARTLTLRLFGLGGGGALLWGEEGTLLPSLWGAPPPPLLSFGLDYPGDPLRSWLDSLVSYVTAPPIVGAMALVGAGLGLVALLTGYWMVRPGKSSWRRVEKSAAGFTSVDLAGLASVVQRRLRTEVDPGIVVAASRRRGVMAVVPTYGGTDPLASVNESAIKLPLILEELGAPGEHSVVSGDPTKRRVR